MKFSFTMALGALVLSATLSSEYGLANTSKLANQAEEKKSAENIFHSKEHVVASDKKNLSPIPPENRVSNPEKKPNNQVKRVKRPSAAPNVTEVKYKAYPKPMKIFPFEVKSTDGKIVTQDTLKGRWSLLTFGFTRCPDVCPMTMSRLKRELNKLSRDSKEKISVYFGTLDPDADKPEILQKYLDSWKIDFSVTGLVESKQVMRKFGSQFSPISESKIQSGSDVTTPNIMHTGVIFVINPAGDLEGYFSESVEGEQIAVTMTKLLR